MTAAKPEAPAGRHGAAQRPARPRPDALGGRGAATPRGEIEVASGRKPRVNVPVDGMPGRARRGRLGEAFAGDPARQARAARGAPALPGRERDRGRRRRHRRRLATAPPRSRRRRRGRRQRAVARARRCSPCAAATWPPTTASSTRRSPPTSRGPSTTPTPPRNTTAAARTSWRRCSPPTSPATVLLHRVVERPGRSPTASSRSARSRPRSRSSPGPSATPTRGSPARCAARATSSSA